jgi:hypothetical protein
VDVLSRREKLIRMGLSENEIRRVFEQDEFEGVVAHLAEISGLNVFPYELEGFGNRVGSMAEIEDDEGGEMGVFRGMVDALKARVAKYPDDRRSKSMLDAYELVIEQAMFNLDIGNKLVFFSPKSEDDGFESKYGLMYVLERQKSAVGRFIFKGRSVLVDLEKSDYGAIYSDPLLEKLSEHDFYRSVVVRAEVFGEDLDLVDVVQTVLGRTGKVGNILGIEDKSVKVWLDTAENTYNELRESVRDKSVGVVENLLKMSTDYEFAWKLQEVRMKALDDYRPDLARQIREKLEIFGYARIDTGCGIVDFMSFGRDGLDATMRGLEGGFKCPNEACGCWIPSGSGDACPYCGYTKWDNARDHGVLCD